MSSKIPSNTGDLIDSALSLPLSDRVVLANAILASMDDAADDFGQKEAGAAWADAIAQRVTEIETGQVRTIPSSKMWNRIGGKPDARN